MKIIPLTQGEEAIVCDCHYAVVSRYKWYTRKKNNTCYAECKTKSIDSPDGKRYNLRMSRLVMPPPRGLIVDHIDGNGLNNQCSNLRIVTLSQNSMNTRKPRNNKSGVKGVCWSNYFGAWRASIMFGGKQKFLGHFDNLDEAIRARTGAEIKYHGEYRRLTT